MRGEGLQRASPAHFSSSRAIARLGSWLQAGDAAWHAQNCATRERGCEVSAPARSGTGTEFYDRRALHSTWHELTNATRSTAAARGRPAGIAGASEPSGRVTRRPTHVCGLIGMQIRKITAREAASGPTMAQEGWIPAAGVSPRSGPARSGRALPVIARVCMLAWP